MQKHLSLVPFMEQLLRAPYSAQCSNSLQGLGGHAHFRDEEIESQRLARFAGGLVCTMRNTMVSALHHQVPWPAFLVRLCPQEAGGGSGLTTICTWPSCTVGPGGRPGSQRSVQLCPPAAVPRARNIWNPAHLRSVRWDANLSLNCWEWLQREDRGQS